MKLLLTYIITVIVCEFFAIQLGLHLDSLSSSLALPLALALFFGVLVLGWPLAVRLHDRLFAKKSEGAAA